VQAGRAILVNGPSSSGKSMLCRALQLRLAELADGDPGEAFARVAFDDVVLLLPENLFPISYVRLQGREVDGLVSRTPHDGRAGWEYVDESDAEGRHGGGPRVRLVMNPFCRRLLRGLHLGWAAHLALGNNLVIDHFLQDRDWTEECVDAVRGSGASLLSVGVRCSLDELERRESSRADGKLEGRPMGLARRSDELCHSSGLDYDVTVDTSRQTTDESVAAILALAATAGRPDSPA
jgi:chloramphenicol 3-O phosphotransferase